MNARALAPRSPGLKVRLGKFNTEQDDGATWSVYYDKDDPRRYLVLTSVGREKVLQGSGIKKGLQAYRMAETNAQGLTSARKKLGQGREATVYSFGAYAVREESKIRDMYKAVGNLGLMDTLSSVVEGGVPRWLDVPKHYALYADPTTGKSYIIMDRIDGGVTVEDIQLYPHLSGDKAKAVEAELGRGIEDAQVKVSELYVEAYEILSTALTESGKQPGTYLNDWKPRNVVVEKVATPLAGSHFTLDVIDQYGTTLVD